MNAATMSQVGETYTGMPKGRPIRSPGERSFGDWLLIGVPSRRLVLAWSSCLDATRPGGPAQTRGCGHVRPRTVGPVT
ncbi:hypothetical protein GCM10010106_00980 [Thermopolyspora flexuosa]|nr:hypothetical protein GCM10010106_00980 [Thermopolyspora flexuosa]